MKPKQHKQVFWGATVAITATVLLVACFYSYAGIDFKMKTASSSLSMQIEALEKYYFTDRLPTFANVRWYLDRMLKIIGDNPRLSYIKREIEHMRIKARHFILPKDMREFIDYLKEEVNKIEGALIKIESKIVE